MSITESNTCFSYACSSIQVHVWVCSHAVYGVRCSVHVHNLHFSPATMCSVTRALLITSSSCDFIDTEKMFIWTSFSCIEAFLQTTVPCIGLGKIIIWMENHYVPSTITLNGIYFLECFSTCHNHIFRELYKFLSGWKLNNKQNNFYAFNKRTFITIVDNIARTALQHSYSKCTNELSFTRVEFYYYNWFSVPLINIVVAVAVTIATESLIIFSNCIAAQRIRYLYARHMSLHT